MSHRIGRVRRAHRRERGFSLLEAIVSLVLIAGVGTALFGWINGNIQALGRVHEANAKSEVTLNVLEYMRGVNPMIAPRGDAVLGNHRIRWESRPATGIVDRPETLYQFALYDTHIDVGGVDGQESFVIALQQAGYRQVRALPGL